MAAYGVELKEPAETSSGHPSRAWRCAGAISLLLSLSFFVPWKPYVIGSSGIDDSWMLALNALFARHLRFGHDLVFTYGPWGFLHTRAYHPDTFGLMLLGWAFFAIAFWCGCWAVGRRRIANPAVLLLWMLAALGVAAFDILHQSATLLCLIGLLLVYAFDPKTKPTSFTSILLVAAVALASLVKFTYLVAAGMVIVPLTIAQLRRRQVPIIPLLFLAFFFAFDLLAGQRMSDLPDYVRLSMQITTGYTDAMSYAPPNPPTGWASRLPPIDLLCFVAAAGLLVVVVSRPLWKRDRTAAALPLLALGGILFATFKWGFVRHDALHAPLAAFVLLFLALLYAASLWPEGAAARRGQLALIATVLAATAVTWNAVLSGTGFALPTYYAYSLMGEVGPNLRAAADLARGTSSLTSAYENAKAAIRSESRAPNINGSVDIYPWSSAVPVASGMNYDPRPVFQSYSAYTPELANLNADHLRGPAAPGHLLLGICDGDFPLDRFPTADDGPSWPEFLTRYTIERQTRDFLVLRKAAHPGHYKFTPLGQVTGRLNTPIPIPSAADGPVWVQIAFQPTPAGKLLAMLYKSPELSFAATSRDGRTRACRTSPGSAAAGFLLSPVINDMKAYERLVHHLPLTGNEVKTITFMERGCIGKGCTFRADISVSFSRLTFSND
ncbi:MAG TPA: hypothetical protein VGI81_17660 [Tepidisphaeraceae bacterium]|jgi:hypothetical protein